MNGFAKFLVGAAATSLLAWGAHALTGDDYVSGLQERAQAALDAGGAEGVTLAMARDPLARVALLSGVTDMAERARIEAAVLAVPGISAVRWDEGGENAAPAEPAAAPAAAAAVAACQTDVDAAMAGKVINFNSGSAYMPESSLAVVDEVANAIRDCAGMTVAVEGHTDSSGPADVNQTLSQARADAVAAALAERGIAAERVSASGFGSSRPITPGDAANAANRRIEFKLASGNAAPAAAAPEGE